MINLCIDFASCIPQVFKDQLSGCFSWHWFFKQQSEEVYKQYFLNILRFMFEKCKELFDEYIFVKSYDKSDQLYFCKASRYTTPHQHKWTIYHGSKHVLGLVLLWSVSMLKYFQNEAILFHLSSILSCFNFSIVLWCAIDKVYL